MKKVLFTIVIAFAAVMAQASSVSWKVTNKEYTGKTIMGFNAADMVAVLGLLDKGGETLANDLEKYVQGSGVANSRGIASDIATSTDGNLFFVAFDADIKDGTGYKMTGTLDATSVLYDPPASAPAAFGADATAFVKSGKIASGVTPPGPDPVPEPTSGLLLVLGGAALALRRKQK